MLVLLFACAPEPGSYLWETTEWSTTCSVGGGGFTEPAAQYLVGVYIENETELWFDTNECVRDGMSYECGDEPVEAALDSGSTSVTVSRAWSGAWTSARKQHGTVSWTTTCAGSACDRVELCDAEWAYEAVNVNDAE